MNSNRNWVLQVDPVVYKFLKKIPRRDAERILISMEDLQESPFSGDIQKMAGEENVWRKRVGAYRIRFEVLNAAHIIHVFRAERRSSKTY